MLIAFCTATARGQTHPKDDPAKEKAESTDAGPKNRFSFGGAVEVLALGTHDQDPDRWWDKDGKPLAGAAKTSFLKKCKADACEPKAVDKDGKKLAGAARNSFLKKCEAGA